MIRIDEIYDITFWPWISKNLPLTRMFFCDPPGRSDPDSLHNYGRDTTELHYILFHDQEPIHLDLHLPLFEDVIVRNRDIDYPRGAKRMALVTSEYNSEEVEKVCAQYGWQSFYYFFHGWAALDWYRGYDRSFVIPDPEKRKIIHSFISPNRIIGGKRDHRVLLMYHLLKKRVCNALISFPETCPAENLPISAIAGKYINQYPDIIDLFSNADLPWDFPNETGHPMHSCWLSLFDECASSLAFVVTETVFHGRRNHLTEKTFKPICMRMPFVLVSTAGSLKYLRSYGFRTFGELWDESYDNEINDDARLEKISDLLVSLDRLDNGEKQRLYQRALPILEHNYQHFYGGEFEKILWDELNGMLSAMKVYWGEYADAGI
jgi:hypothetical protein